MEALNKGRLIVTEGLDGSGKDPSDVNAYAASSFCVVDRCAGRKMN